MLVVGGTYAESCIEPRWQTTQGSGMRAAASLSARGARLLTAVDAQLADDAELVAGAVQLAERQVVSRSGPIGFDYFTPLSTPRITGGGAVVDEVLAATDDDCALVYGFLESVRFRVRSRRLVFDPQSPGAGGPIDLSGLEADEVAVVLNAGEARAFGGSRDLLTSVANLFDQTEAAVVVVKSGASGCRVFQNAEELATGVSVGACPTAHVWPLGSGDTFAAGFAHAWSAGADPVEAARIGSAAAAYWCGTQDPVLPEAVLSGNADSLGLSLLEPTSTADTPRVYLAGPFFNLGELWLVELVRNALLAQGVEVFSPLHDVGRGDDSVARADIEGLRTCSSVLALLDGSDFGTVFETGWAECAHIPVVGYATRPDEEGTKMLTGLSGELHNDLSTAVYRAAWRALGAPALPRPAS